MFNINNFIRYYENNNDQAAIYKEHLQKLKKQNNEMAEKVVDIEKMLASQFHSHDTSLLFQKEQLHLEQQQLYKLINIFEVNMS